MQVIGLCRFSYLGEGGFQINHETLQERAAFLYAPERLEERFRTFETMTLPPLRAQTDPDFTFLIVTGDSLPTLAYERLMDLTRGMPQVVVQKHAPENHRGVMRKAINSVRLFNQDLCAQFRMDDDDAVACCYVQKLRETVEDVRSLAQKHRHIAIDYNTGFIARPGPDGLKTTAVNNAYTTAALAIVFRREVSQTVMNFSHMKVGRSMPTVTFTGEDMLVRGHNDYNDSRQKTGVKPVKLLPQSPEEEAHFKKVYNIDADDVRRVFSAP
ncbi:MAG: hypothetical protein ACI8Q6_000336 [Granulosicoccus sp.]|jgi:hypothetical protein